MKKCILEVLVFFMGLSVGTIYASDSERFREAGEAIEKGNCDLGIKIFEEMAGRKVPGALVNLGIIYNSGKCGNQDLHKAYLLYKSAAELDIAQGHYQYGLLHFGDDSYNPDYDLVFKHWSRALEQGLPIHYEISILYYKGLGVEADPLKAESLLLEGARRGDSHSIHLLLEYYKDIKSPLYKNK
ncbi:tetratricopeptide repeat protein [Pseudomonas flexibilis]|uniref:tetratricopeptide repeat protein n=1 Tax=Pseudomonas flexibilis TaxID=706570 RepID=UPI0009707207|nr:tetratricopeptide repeat protein [Pseudomonas flexibilis]